MPVVHTFIRQLERRMDEEGNIKKAHPIRVVIFEIWILSRAEFEHL